MSAAALDQMTPEQRVRFQSRVEGLGVTLDEAMATRVSTKGAKAPVVLSMDLDRTTIAPRIAVVPNIATMKKQGGVSDALYGRGELADTDIKYPPPWDPKQNRLIDKAGSRPALAALLTPAMRSQIREAMDAWMLGNSEKVRSYETIIDALHFPVYAANWTLASICVSANTVLVLTPPPNTPDPPTLVVTGNVCIEQGGMIQFQVPTTLEVYGTMQLLEPGQCACPPSSGNS